MARLVQKLLTVSTSSSSPLLLFFSCSSIPFLPHLLFLLFFYSPSPYPPLFLLLFPSLSSSSSPALLLLFFPFSLSLFIVKSRCYDVAARLMEPLSESCCEYFPSSSHPSILPLSLSHRLSVICSVFHSTFLKKGKKNLPSRDASLHSCRSC